MPKVRQEEIDKIVKQQEADVYGTPFTDGEDPDLDNPEEMLKKSIGNDPDVDHEGFSLADEEEGDAKAILHGEPEDTEEDELEAELDED